MANGVDSERTWIVIDDWRRFQHYKDRNPLWIKTYTELMNDDDYLSLSGHRRAILHGIWLEYATSRCRLAVDTLSLTRRLNLRVTTADLEALNHAGFIGFAASKPLADGYQSASPEKEGEKRTPPAPPRGARRRNPEPATPLADTWDRFLAGHAWDESFDETQMLDELRRRREKHPGQLADEAALALWQQARAARYPDGDPEPEVGKPSTTAAPGATVTR